MRSRRKKIGSPENHERWLVSYADFITLLFAFFVVMFASSQTDRAKAQQVSDSITKAFSNEKLASAISGILGGAPGLKEQGNAMRHGPGGVQKSDLVPSLRLLQSQLKTEIASGMLQVSMEARGGRSHAGHRRIRSRPAAANRRSLDIDGSRGGAPYPRQDLAPLVGRGVAHAHGAARSDRRGLDGVEGRVKARPAANLQVVLHVAGAIALVVFAVLLPSLIAAGASFLIFS